MAGCSYQLSIRFQLLQFDLPYGSDLSPAHWEASWLDANGNVLNIDSEAFDSDPASFATEARLLAPPNATNVDLRCINSSPNTHALILANVSFTPTQQALRNSTFQQLAGPSTDRTPVGWTLESGLLDTTKMPIRLRDDGTDDTILSQVVDVIAGDMYELRVSAQPEKPIQSDSASLPLQQRARLELQWQSNGQPGDVITLTLDGPTFSESAWAGTVPAGITQVAIRLIQPKSSATSLLVAAATLTHIELIPVPLTFLSDAPGQLTVSKMHVVYDFPTSLPPSKGKATIVSSTSGTRIPTPIAPPSIASTTSTVSPSITPAVNTPVTPQPPATSTTSAAQPSAMAIAMEPLTAIPGIGEARAYQLEKIGIDSLDKLAAASPDDIAQTLKGVKVELAASFITEAQQILAARHP